MQMIDDYATPPLEPDESFDVPPSVPESNGGIFSKLAAVQAEMKVPKGRKNDFGHYSYRSYEDIMNAAKPVLANYNLCLYVSDDIVKVGDRYYVRATATIADISTGRSLSVTSAAREALDKKGMDDAQITGAASSYARKYALSGLFCLDDEQDPDCGPPPESSPPKPLICKKCGKEIKGQKTRSGEFATAEEIAAAFGGLCPSCASGASK